MNRTLKDATIRRHHDGAMRSAGFVAGAQLRKALEDLRGRETLDDQIHSKRWRHARVVRLRLGFYTPPRYSEKVPVFPCRPDRAPCQGFKAASDDPARIRESWTKHPAALTSRVGFDTSKKLELQLDHLLQVATPSGGVSLNLRCTVRNSAPYRYQQRPEQIP
jgi:hypothetical protein